MRIVSVIDEIDRYMGIEYSNISFWNTIYHSFSSILRKKKDYSYYFSPVIKKSEFKNWLNEATSRRCGVPVVENIQQSLRFNV